MTKPFEGKKELRSLFDFEGDWTMSRRIDDRRTGEVLKLEGRARLRSVPDGLLYEETGTLVLADGTPVTASRRYFWRDAGDRVAVEFEDGRAFHSFPLADRTPEASHWCDPDAYEVRYDLSGWPSWQAAWRVRGPRKDYRMVTQYWRD